MKTNEARDSMVALVQEAYAEFPAFVSLPEVKSRDITMRVRIENPDDNAAYVAGLHEFCASGQKPTGRRGKDLVA